MTSLSADDHLPAIGRLKPRNDAEQGRLAGPARPEKGDELMLTDVEIDAVDSLYRAEILGDGPERERDILRLHSIHRPLCSVHERARIRSQVQASGRLDVGPDALPLLRR